MAREDTSITSRWFIDDGRPMADAELTREIRDIDMLPASAGDREQLAHGLAYRAVRIRGGRILPVDPPESYADDDLTDAFEVEDPFDTGDSVVLPTNGAGRMHAALARLVERGFEAWERWRLRVHGWTGPLRGEAGDGTRAPTVRFAAIFSASLMVLGMFVFVSVASFAIGSTVVQAEQSVTVPVKHQRVLRKLAQRWASAQNPDMEFSVDEVDDPAIE